MASRGEQTTAWCISHCMQNRFNTSMPIQTSLCEAKSASCQDLTTVRLGIKTSYNHQMMAVLFPFYQPFIQSHPEKQRVVAPGTNVEFKIEATGVDLEFQWKKNRNTDLADDEKYCDTDTETLHIVEVEKGDKGRYRCCVSNHIGETFSEEAVLTVSKLVIHVVMCFMYLGLNIL